MKNILLVCVVALFVLGACTEEIIKIEKEIVRDTVMVDRFIDRYFSGTDTVTITQVIEVPIPARSQTDTVIQYVTDTIYLQRIDTVWRTEILVEHDTVMIREVTFGDTLIQYLWPKGAYGLPTELEPMYGEFFAEVDRRGITYQGSGSAFLIQYKSMDSSLQAYSFDYGGQIVILISDKLTVDQCYVPLFRELSRVFLKKEYSADPNSPMNPFWSGIQDVRWSNRNQFPEVADEIFR